MAGRRSYERRHQASQAVNSNYNAVLNANTINVKVAFMSVSCPIDSGASVSVISETMLNKFPPYCYRIIDGKLPVVFIASGQPLQVTKAAELTLNVNGLLLPFTFNVSPSLSTGHAIIIGKDFLTEFDCVINVAAKSLSFYHDLTCVNMQTRRTGPSCVAKVTKDVLIPARSEIIMPLDVFNVTDYSTYELTPTHDLSKKSIAMARAVVQPINGRVNCRIMNPTNTVVSLKRHTVIGTLQYVPVNAIVQLNSPSDIDEQLLSASDSTSQPVDLTTAEAILTIWVLIYHNAVYQALIKIN